MLLKIPFYENTGDGNQCMQVAMKCALKYFLGKEVSLEELDRLTGRKANFWTCTPQIVPALYDIGLELKFYSTEDLESFREGESFIKKHFGEDSKEILKHIDVPELVKSTNKLMNYDLFEKKKLSLDELEEHLKEGHLPMVLIDYNKIARRKDLYLGHFVVVTGFDKEHIYFHEPGPKDPQPNMKVPKKVFEDAFNANGTDNDCIIVYGKRNWHSSPK